MSEDTQRVSIHGRVFQKISIDDRIYLAPIANDDREEERLTAQHDILARLFGGALFSPGIRLRDPQKVLDCGYGGGDWCVQFAEEYEDCEVRICALSSDSRMCTVALTCPEGRWPLTM